jgi:hypothetical protein
VRGQVIHHNHIPGAQRRGEPAADPREERAAFGSHIGAVDFRGPRASFLSTYPPRRSARRKLGRWTNSLDLNAVTGGDLSVPLTDRTLWTNQPGKSASDRTPNWQDWTGTWVALSPYDGFTKAMKNVKEIGLSLGSKCRYASGVALVEGTGTFTVNSFTIQQSAS